MKSEALKILKEYYGYDNFREGDHMEEIMADQEFLDELKRLSW